MKLDLIRHAAKMRERSKIMRELPAGPLARVHKVVRDRFGFEYNIPGNWRRELVPRQIAMYLTRRLVPGASFQAIGIYYGFRHYATVMNAVKNVARDRAEDPNMDRLLTELEDKLRMVPVRAPYKASQTRRLLIAEVLGRRAEGV